MAQIHEKLPKGTLNKGEKYIVIHNDIPLYQAEVLKYGGGCWATIQIVQPLHEGNLYHIGDTFDIKVAMYQFEQ